MTTPFRLPSVAPPQTPEALASSVRGTSWALRELGRLAYAQCVPLGRIDSPEGLAVCTRLVETILRSPRVRAVSLSPKTRSLFRAHPSLVRAALLAPEVTR